MMSLDDLRKLSAQIILEIEQRKIKASKARTQMKLYSSTLPPEEIQLKYAIEKSKYDKAKQDLATIKTMIAKFY